MAEITRCTRRSGETSPCRTASALQQIRVSYVPQPLIGRDQTFLGTAIPPGREVGRALDHEIQDTQQLPGGLDIPLVAGLMKGDQDLVGQAPGVAWFWR